MSTVLVLSGCSTKDTLKTYAYLPTMVLNGVGDIASMQKQKGNSVYRQIGAKVYDET